MSSEKILKGIEGMEKGRVMDGEKSNAEVKEKI